jgi:hypothetical protein
MFNWSKWPSEFTYAIHPKFPQDFPNLRPHMCVNGVSDATRDYNCIAWAASDISRRWEPDPFFQWYWPDGVQRNYSMQAHLDAFRTLGFEICTGSSLEEGVEKIALYTSRGEPLHAARQLTNGNWTSKLGDYEDIQHIDLGSLNGPCYGAPSTYMSRLIAQP